MPPFFAILRVNLRVELLFVEMLDKKFFFLFHYTSVRFLLFSFYFVVS